MLPEQLELYNCLGKSPERYGGLSSFEAPPTQHEKVLRMYGSIPIPCPICTR
jgi:hypothetical protein